MHIIRLIFRYETYTHRCTSASLLFTTRRRRATFRTWTIYPRRLAVFGGGVPFGGLGRVHRGAGVWFCKSSGVCFSLFFRPTLCFARARLQSGGLTCSYLKLYLNTNFFFVHFGKGKGPGKNWMGHFTHHHRHDRRRLSTVERLIFSSQLVSIFSLGSRTNE